MPGALVTGSVVEGDRRALERRGSYSLPLFDSVHAVVDQRWFRVLLAIVAVAGLGVGGWLVFGPGSGSDGQNIDTPVADVNTTTASVVTTVTIGGMVLSPVALRAMAWGLGLDRMPWDDGGSRR